jgi:glucose dehydrogenase
MFTPTPGKNIVAVNAATGQERWRFAPRSLTGTPSSTPARRGLLYWKGDEKASARLMFGDGDWLVAGRRIGLEQFKRRTGIGFPLTRGDCRGVFRFNYS